MLMVTPMWGLWAPQRTSARLPLGFQLTPALTTESAYFGPVQRAWGQEACSSHQLSVTTRNYTLCS